MTKARTPGAEPSRAIGFDRHGAQHLPARRYVRQTDRRLVRMPSGLGQHLHDAQTFDGPPGDLRPTAVHILQKEGALRGLSASGKRSQAAGDWLIFRPV